MKKGCFLSSIIILTIVIGIGLYLYKKYWHEISDYGKEKIIEVSINDINEEINKLEKSIYQDSLKLLLKEQFTKYKDINFEDSMKKFGHIIEQANYFINDGSIDSLEFKTLKNLTTENDRSTKK